MPAATDSSLTQEGKEELELFEEGSQARLQDGEVGISNSDALAAGVRSGDHLDSAHGNFQSVG